MGEHASHRVIVSARPALFFFGVLANRVVLDWAEERQADVGSGLLWDRGSREPGGTCDLT